MSCKHFNRTLCKDDRYYILAEQHNNCLFCLVDDKGAMTQEEVGSYLSVTKMRICQIEKIALRRFKKKLEMLTKEKNFTLD